MARPQKQSQDLRTHRLPHVRCTESEGLKIRRKAAQAGLSVSEYLRHVALTGGVIKSNDNAQESFDRDLIDELHRVGNNLNQLTKKYHQQNIEPGGLRALFPILEKLLNHVFTRITV